MNIKVLRPSDAQHILQYERNILASNIEDDIERELASWHAPWRNEALEFYLPLGWSFAAWDGEEGDSSILAYFLGQPLLYFKSMAQSLWIEHMQASSPRFKDDILIVAYKLCREKHFQQLLIAPSIDFDQNFWRDKMQEKPPQHYVLSTSKMVGQL